MTSDQNRNPLGKGREQELGQSREDEAFLLKAMSQHWAHELEPNGGWDPDAVWQRAMAPQRQPAIVPIGKRPSGRGLWNMGVATALAVAIGMAIWSGQPTTPSSSAVSAQYRTFPGQRARIQLAQGTMMMLAPASSAQVHGDEVVLQGEAYFEVHPDARRPFSVTTDNAKIQVLGTRFSIRQYANDVASQVVVEDGKVAVQSLDEHASATKPAVLSAAMLGIVTDSGVTVKSGVPTHNYTGWIEGRLVFSQVPLQHVVAELAQAYGMAITIADSMLAKEPVTLKVSFDTQPVAQVLELIGRATNAHYTRNKAGFVLAPGRVASRETQDKPIPQLERLYGR